MAKDLLSQILDIISLFLGKPQALSETPKTIEIQPEIPQKAEVLPEISAKTPEIDWNDPKYQITPHFTVKDAIFLPSWNRLANEKDGLDDTIKANLLKLLNKMETVRDYFGKPIRVHVSYRPVEYNKAIGGALHSQHSVGAAMDFDVIGMNCDDVRKQINDNNMLDAWYMRMEDMPGGSWVHLDSKEMVPGGHRFFKP